tara:strand:- start:2989 stop:3225 length:237 start_codon:yes stop_codon:yes gene_type:complete
MNRKKNRTGLSNTQNVRFGGLIAVIDSREPYPTIMEDLETRGFALRQQGNVIITDKGRKETVRLATLAGLMTSIEKGE